MGKSRRGWGVDRPPEIYDDDPVRAGNGVCEVPNCGRVIQHWETYCFDHVKQVPKSVREKGAAAIAAYAYAQREKEST